MIRVASDVLTYKLKELSLFSRLGSLVIVAEVPREQTDAGGNRVKTGVDRYPVDCGFDGHQKPTLSEYVPDETKGAVGFFMDSGGCQFVEYDKTGRGSLKYRFGLKFLAWMNLKAAGIKDCHYANTIVPVLIEKMMGQHRGDCVSSLDKDWFSNIEVTGINQMVKSPEIFNPFTFVESGRDTGIFLPPYDYFGLNILGTFSLGLGCIDCDALPVFSNIETSKTP